MRPYETWFIFFASRAFFGYYSKDNLKWATSGVFIGLDLFVPNPRIFSMNHFCNYDKAPFSCPFEFPSQGYVFSRVIGLTTDHYQLWMNESNFLYNCLDANFNFTWMYTLGSPCFFQWPLSLLHIHLCLFAHHSKNFPTKHKIRGGQKPARILGVFLQVPAGFLPTRAGRGGYRNFFPAGIRPSPIRPAWV